MPFGSLFGSYETVKIVEIKDARLAVLRYCFLIGIVLYVFVFEMLQQGGWLMTLPVVGTIRFSIQHPTKDGCDPSNPECTNDFNPVNTIPYCSQFNRSSDNNNIGGGLYGMSSYNGTVLDCQIYEAHNAQIVNAEKSVGIMTRGSAKEQSLVCDTGIGSSNQVMTCPHTYNDTATSSKFYVAQSEDFTILLDHAVTATEMCEVAAAKPTASNSHRRRTQYACSSEASQYQGRLRVSHNHQLCADEFAATGNVFKNPRSSETSQSAPCFIGPNRTRNNQDFFSLNVLLKAVEVSLDDCNPTFSKNTSDETKISCQTYRETGGTMLLSIYWSDFVPYRGLVEPYYYYAPQFMEGSYFKQEISYYEKYRTKRTLLNGHGVKVAVLLGGAFHRFNLLRFLVTLTTALGLLAVATKIVDMMMLYILPEKKRYQEAKYEEHAGEFFSLSTNSNNRNNGNGGNMLRTPWGRRGIENETGPNQAIDTSGGGNNEENQEMYELLLGSPSQS